MRNLTAIFLNKNNTDLYLFKLVEYEFSFFVVRDTGWNAVRLAQHKAAACLRLTFCSLAKPSVSNRRLVYAHLCSVCNLNTEIKLIN